MSDSETRFFESKLMTRAIEETRARKGNLTTVAKACGVTHGWLMQFMRGEIPDPSVRRVERLLEHYDAYPVWSPEEQDA